MRLLACALEASANAHLRALLSNECAELYGIFDTQIFGNSDGSVQPNSQDLERIKSHAFCDFKEFNAMGFIEVLPLIFKAKRAIAKLAQTAMCQAIETVLLIDSPAFNIPLARALRSAGFTGRIVYFILPQVWAWKRGRVAKLEPLCDALVGILPFEREFWGKKFSYFGNPIYEITKPFFRVEPAASCQNFRQSTRPKIAFLPGSRKREIASLMPTFCELAAMIKQRNPDAICLLSRANEAADYGDTALFCPASNALEALQQADFAYVCSGTASLQAALIGTPFALAYRARALDFFIAKNFVKISHIGLANIILMRSGAQAMHAEFVQNFSAEQLFCELENVDAAGFFERSKQLRSLLGELEIKEILKLIKNK